jgi:hypothetical protein
VRRFLISGLVQSPCLFTSISSILAQLAGVVFFLTLVSMDLSPMYAAMFLS